MAVRYRRGIGLSKVPDHIQIMNKLTTIGLGHQISLKPFHIFMNMLLGDASCQTANPDLRIIFR